MDESLKEHYRDLLRQHGPGPEAVQHADAASQEQRFRILAEGIPADATTVLDVGCGLGHFYEFIRERRPELQYTGIDMVPEFIHSASQAYQDDARTAFHLLDASSDAWPEGHDVTLFCGIFNNRIEDNRGFLEEMLCRARRTAKKAVLFNALSSYVDYQDDHLYYANPLELFDFCKRQIASLVTLRHDYRTKPDTIPYEFSIYCYLRP